MRSTLLLMFNMLLAGTLVISTTGQTGNPGASASKMLHDLFDAEWEYAMRDDPPRASDLGDRRWNDRWRDQSLQAIERRHQHNLDILARLAKIDRG
ncbi:MAG TPA: DUF885 domain-containing protein, partial [Candidatus Angelobacter sp.]|nr:DUF885 domain-containing protein [Candidatus Angelobacter sp.]